MKEYLSVIVRFHSENSLAWLMTALQSLESAFELLSDVVVVTTNVSCSHKIKSMIEYQIATNLVEKVSFVNITSEADSRSKAIVVGVNEAKGEYVLFLDYDDEFDGRAVKILSDYARVSQYKIVAMDYSFIFYSPGRLGRKFLGVRSEHRTVLSRKSYSIENHSPMGSFIVEKGLLGSVPVEEHLIYMEDYHLLLRCLLSIHEKEYKYIPVKLLKCWRDSSKEHQQKYAEQFPVTFPAIAELQRILKYD